MLVPEAAFTPASAASITPAEMINQSARLFRFALRGPMTNHKADHGLWVKPSDARRLLPLAFSITRGGGLFLDAGI